MNPHHAHGNLPIGRQTGLGVIVLIFAVTCAPGLYELINTLTRTETAAGSNSPSPATSAQAAGLPEPGVEQLRLRQTPGAEKLARQFQ